MTWQAECGRYLDPGAERLLHGVAVPRRALFLDRDGVINVDHGYVHQPERTEWIPGIFELARAAQVAGYLPVVVTNQAGIARGFYTEAQFLDYTRWLHAEFARRGAPLFGTYYCPHHPTAGLGNYRRECGCRKPAAGMILRAGEDLSLDLGASLLLGDKESDMEAASVAGLRRARLFRSDLGSALPTFQALFT